MSKTKDYILIFDDQCPICRTYSKVFEATGFVDEKSLEGFQNISEETCVFVDRKRACNEIALVNRKTGETIYGVDSILKLITLQLPIFTSFLYFKPIYWILKRLYLLIAFNRKIIFPNVQKTDTCVPDFNLKYRLGYILVTQLFFLVGWMVYFNCFNTITSLSFSNLLLQITLLNLVLPLLFIKKDNIQYFNVLGNFSTILVLSLSFFSIVLLLELILGKLSEEIIFVIYGTMVLSVFFELLRRFKFLKDRFLFSFILPLWLMEILLLQFI